MTEATQKEIEKGNEALIAEMLRDAQKAEVVSELSKNPVLHKGDETLPAPMTVKEITGAGYLWVWDTRTFEKLPILYYMLPQRLRDRRPDGSFRFTTTDPNQTPKHGTVRCLLHPEREERKHFDELGFRICNKHNLINQYQLQQHMKKKHPQEWATIEEEKKTKEKEEDRALQRLLLLNQTSKVSKETEATTEPEPVKSLKCPQCGAGDFKSEKALKHHTEVCK